MTVTYSLECSSNKFGNFFRLLFRWRGSIYKILYKDLAIFLMAYFGLSASYRFLMNDDQSRFFEKFVDTCSVGADLIPLTFVLGFFVTLVVDRWWNNFLALPWPDRAAIKIACYIPGDEQRDRMIRRTLVRYLNLTLAIVLRDASSTVKKRFPTEEHLVNAGLMTSEELKQYLHVKTSYPNVYVYWVPVIWAANLLIKAREEDRIKSDFNFRSLHKEVLGIRSKLGDITSYDWITIPLVYTQVITIAVHSFFIFCLVARQYVRPDGISQNANDPSNIDLVIPPFTVLQFLFYMGWLKVAQVLINPFGEDDDDFEVNYLLDRHLQVSYMIVDDYYDILPPLKRDIHWKEENIELPHTKASWHLKNNPLIGSMSNYVVPKRLQSIVEQDFKCNVNNKSDPVIDDIIDSLAT